MSFYLGRKAIRKVPGVVIKAAPLPNPTLYEGFGKRAEVGAICEQAGFKTALVVTDQTLFSLGLHEKITASLTAHGVAYTLFHEIDSEPTVRVVDAGRKAAAEAKADCVVALGGGSVLDSGKIIAAAAKHPNAAITHYLHKFAFAGNGTLPMINVPSTAGTGAECTVGAVVKNKRGTKSSTVIIGMEVTAVILDSELLIGAPPAVTTWCAIDALSHGLEGLLADVDSSEEDIKKSRECVRLVMENLPVLLKDPKNIEARQATLLAAHYGGNAINTQLAGYVHAFAHSIGALYHIPHGKAIAWCLVPIVEAQENIRSDALKALAVYCGIAHEAEEAEAAADRMILALRRLLVQCGLENGCKLLKPEDYDRLVGMIDADSINYSPSRTFSDSEIVMLLDQIRRGY
ncbi:MAG: iron-containing alcohol dehydrogenase [Clostridia bacterium]|nr:iron-containing alcohol dehydrogenase [Clostridia bacterium]